MDQGEATVIGAAIGALGTLVVGYLPFVASKNKTIDAEHEKFRKLQAQCYQLEEWVKIHPVVTEIFQPVLLLGPRDSGKTSLRYCWEAPWDRWDAVPKTGAVMEAYIPLAERSVGSRPHPAAPTILAPWEYRLGIDLVDVPGDISFWKDGLKLFRQKHNAFQALFAEEKARYPELEKLGTLPPSTSLILMMDCSNKAETKSYYRTEFFAGLSAEFPKSSKTFSRMIVVFNKIDTLSPERSGYTAVSNTCMKDCFKEEVAELTSMASDMGIDGAPLFCCTVLAKPSGATTPTWREGEREVLSHVANTLIAPMAKLGTSRSTTSSSIRPPSG